MRLHLLASGALVRNKAEKWRIMYRNGYTSSEDPGLVLRMQYPHIIQQLKMYTIYQLSFRDIIRVLNCLMAQILTYSSPLNIIEERMEQMSKGRSDLRALNTAENKRVNSVQFQRKTLVNEFNQQCLEENVKNDPEQKRQMEEKLNKKIAELMAQSDRDHKKYLQKVEEMNSCLFNHLVFLGMDRAYRKYYVFESLPGIFIEHSADSMDTCLSDPPTNKINTHTKVNSEMPKTRKELRAFLMKIYTEEEKKAAEAEKNKLKNKEISADSQENKENEANQLVNGLTNGHAETVVKDEVNENGTATNDATPPTQYQLYMCTGDKRNCIVHDERNADRQRWAYIYETEDIDALIESLNPAGERECQLRDQLTTLRHLIIQHVRKCPFDMLSLKKSEMTKFRSQMLSDTSRKYNKSNFGFPLDHGDLNEVMYSALVERILQFESDIYTGDLGRLKVKNMQKWRDDVSNNTYDPQGKLQWGPAELRDKIQQSTENNNECEEDEEENQEGEESTHEGGKYAGLGFRDPGAYIGKTNEIDTDDSDDDAISLHDSDTLKTCVKNLASALLQVEQAIERRFMKEPFGISHKDIKDKEAHELQSKMAKRRLLQWELSLMECTSYSQVSIKMHNFSVILKTKIFCRSFYT